MNETLSLLNIRGILKMDVSFKARFSLPRWHFGPWKKKLSSSVFRIWMRSLVVSSENSWIAL